MQSFYFLWGVSALALLSLAIWAGRQASFKAVGKPTSLGILIDARERFSLNRLQLVMWTLLILSTFISLLVVNLGSDPNVALKIPPHLLGLLGISAGSATVAGAIKDGKDTTRPHKIAGGAGFHARAPVRAAVNGGAVVSTQQPRFVQVFLEEEGDQAQNHVVSVTKFQNFIFTMALGSIYVVLTANAQGYPAFNDEILWLVGISSAGYVGGKVPDKD